MEYDESVADKIARSTVCVSEPCTAIRTYKQSYGHVFCVHIITYTTYITILCPYLSLSPRLCHNKMTNDTNKLCSLYLFSSLFPLLNGKLTNYNTERNMFTNIMAAQR